MLLLAALLQTVAPTASCAALATTDPGKAVEAANGWYLKGGGALAKQCAGLAYAAQENWTAAAQAFEQGAREAERARQSAAAGLWVQAANARLAAGDAPGAIRALDAALVSGALSDAGAGEARLDRARANVLSGDLPAARIDMNEALKLAPKDPLAWLLSASLARRMGELDRAQADIDEAATLSPDDASVALEAGRIALAAGAPAAARIAWEGAIKSQPGSDAAKAAQGELDRLGGKAQPAAR